MNKIRFTLQARKPRNPLSVAARRRQAGRHDRSPGGVRQAQRRDMWREVADWHSPPPTV
ncbi:MAG TPA: hypothetical protein VN680_07980 [Burkholderiaceae bacterium]|nr:hypothetical protein [Burkholderiaceae bacterium]